MLVILDTNIWLAGLFWSGHSHKILQLLLHFQLIQVAFSEETYTELTSTLIKHHRKFSGKNNTEMIGSLRTIGIFFTVTDQKLPFSSRDPKDNQFLQLALASNAEFLITGDKDLLVLQKMGSTKIITQAEFLKKAAHRLIKKRN